eukprot:215851_1
MMTVYEEILENTDDNDGWKWLKRKFIPSLIWYSAHPANAGADKDYYEVIWWENGIVTKSDMEKNPKQRASGQFKKLASFYEKDADQKMDQLSHRFNENLVRNRHQLRVKRVNGKVVGQDGRWNHWNGKVRWKDVVEQDASGVEHVKSKGGETRLNEYLAVLDEEKKE